MSRKQSFLYSQESLLAMMAVFTVGNDHVEETGHEHGGILIGPPQARIITHAILSSDAAHRSAVTYFQTEEDVAYLNEQLRRYQARGLAFKGYFHRHPSGMTQLSGGDLDTCRAILADPDYDINNELVMTILTASKSTDLPIFTYVASLDNDQVRVRPVQQAVLPHAMIHQVTRHFSRGIE